MRRGSGRFGRWGIGLVVVLSVSAAGLPAAQATPRRWLLSEGVNPGTDNEISGVSCASATFCVAVGTFAAGSTSYHTLIEQWDGTNWSKVPSPNPGTEQSGLHGVACTSATSCVAVGSQQSDGSQHTLVESWDGIAWTVVPSPNPPSETATLASVACLSATSCFAVGIDDGSPVKTLAEAWDGTAWTLVPTPNPRSAIAAELYSISCSRANRCMAVGEQNTLNGRRALVEKWNGSRWAVASSPSLAAGSKDAFFSVSCSSPHWCVAVGYTESGGAAGPLIAAWDGTQWTVQSFPNPGLGGNLLAGVSCLTPTRCIAVGSYNEPGHGDFDRARPLVEAWDGAAWSVVPTFRTGRVNTFIQNVSCAFGGACVAVADRLTASPFEMDSFAGHV